QTGARPAGLVMTTLLDRIRAQADPTSRIEFGGLSVDLVGMSQGNIAVTMRVRCPLGAQEQDLWDSLIPEFTQEVLYPSCVQLVITDRYEELAGTYAVQSASQLNQATIAADYRSAKPGGAVAVAKKVDL